MFQTLIAQAGLVFASLACAFGLIWGGWPERVGSAGAIVAWVASAAFEDRHGLHHHGVHLHGQPAIALIDVLYGGLLLYLLLGTPRRWVIVAFAAQTVIVLTHAATAIDPRVTQFDFFSAYYVMSYIVVASVAIGAAVEGRRPLTNAATPKDHAS